MADIVRGIALYRQGVLGSEDNPWGSGESVFVWTNGTGALVFEGRGRTDDFASAEERPWAETMPGVTATRVAETVTLGANSLKGIVETAPINGLVPSDLFAALGGQEPAGAISGAEPEKVAIIDGKAYLDVSVCTNGEVTATTEGWEKAKIEAVDLDKETGTAILTIPATAETGFMILKSKTAVSDVKD